MARRLRGWTDEQISNRLNELDGDDTDDDLADIEIEPEPDPDDGIEVEEEVVYENAVSHFWSITEQRIFAFFHLIPGVRIRIHNLRFSWGIRILDLDSKHAPAAFGKN